MKLRRGSERRRPARPRRGDGRREAGRGRRRGLRGRGPIKAEIERLEARLAELAGDEPSRRVGESEVAAVVAARTGIPVGELVAGELERLQELEADLHSA